MVKVTLCNNSRLWKKLKKCIANQGPQDWIRWIVLVICLIIVYYQLIDCCMKLRNPPINTRSKLALNDSLSYPALTVCREPPYNKRLFPKFNFSTDHIGSFPYTSQWKYFPYDRYNISDFWNEAVYKKNVFSGYSLNQNSVEISSSIHLQSGMCHTIRPNFTVEDVGKKSGYSLLLNHDLYDYRPLVDEEPGWKIYVHEPKEKFSVTLCLLWLLLRIRKLERFTQLEEDIPDVSPSITTTASSVDQHRLMMPLAVIEGETSGMSSYNRTGHSIVFLGIIAKVNGITNENINFLSSRQDPIFVPVGEVTEVSIDAHQFNILTNCSSKEDYSVTECEENCTINEDIKPIVNCTGPWFPTIDKPMCNTGIEMKLLLRATLSMKNKHCCIKSCKNTYYKIFIVKRTPCPPERNLTSVAMIYFSSKAVITMEERYSYNWNDFLGEIGGTVGFLLGLSIVGVIGIIDKIIRFLFVSKE